MILLKVEGNSCFPGQLEELASGNRNALECAFIFDEEWACLEKTACFRAEGREYGVLLNENDRCMVPWEVLEKPVQRLQVGVCGTKGGQVVKPTLWASLGAVQPGARTDQMSQLPPTDVYGDILSKANHAESVAAGVRADADAGVFNGKDGKDGADYILTPEDKQALAAEAAANAMETPVLQQAVSDSREALDRSVTAELLAKGMNTAKGFADYAALIAELNEAPADKYKVGQSFLIVTLNVPDLWVSAVEETTAPYEYADDTTVIALLQSVGYIRVGHYSLSMLETLKQDLTNYVKDTDYASAAKAGIVKLSGWTGIAADDGVLRVEPANQAHIDERSYAYLPIAPSSLDYAVKSALARYDPVWGGPWTEEEKAAAQATLGGQMIKTAEADGDGVYAIYTYEAQPGVYYLPKGTKIYVSTQQHYTTQKEGSILFISQNDSQKELFLIGESYYAIYGGYTKTDRDAGYWSQQLNFVSTMGTHSTQNVPGVKTFTNGLKMSKALDATDDSENVPNTAWVNAAIQKAIQDALNQ